MQYFSTCDISEFGFRYPLGYVPVQVCYIQSIVVYVLSSIGTLVCSGGMRLYCAIFVIYAYDRILHDSPTTCRCGTALLDMVVKTWLDAGRP